MVSDMTAARLKDEDEIATKRSAKGRATPYTLSERERALVERLNEEEAEVDG